MPRVLRYLALVLAGLNLWLAGDTIVRYLRLPLSFPKISEALWERRAGLKLCFPEPVITCAAGVEQRSPEVARFGIFLCDKGSCTSWEGGLKETEFRLQAWFPKRFANFGTVG